MNIKSLHHVAYRCKDAKQTAAFYTEVLGLEYAMALAEDRVPSTGEHSPYMHVFFRMDDGSYVAFFEVPESPPMDRDRNTPARPTTPSASRSTSSTRAATASSSRWTPLRRR
jgi:glyoxylase I family protein